jgi:integrating conjugative element protein (TIGR03761 family)
MTEQKNRPNFDEHIKPNDLNSISKIGGNETSELALFGTMTENKPDIPSVKIEFNTKAAPLMLFSKKGSPRGNGTHFIQGVDWFDTKLTKILTAVRQDDPFADQLLLNLEMSIFNLGQFYREEQAKIHKLIEQHFNTASAEINISKNSHSLSVEITLAHRLSYNLLWLVKELDTLLYFLFYCDQYSILMVKDIKERREILKKKFRQVLAQINLWTSTGISREDLAYNTAKVQKAFEKNNKVLLSKEVIYLELRADCAPEISSHRNDILDSGIYEKLKNLYK